MNDDSSDSKDASLPLPVLERIDGVCLDFEAAWKAGGTPRIEEYLGHAEGAERSQLFQELLLLDLDYRSHPTPEEYQARFPHDRELVGEVFQQFSTGAGLDETTAQGAVSTIARQRPPGKFGGYDLLEVLGEGGMGIVYRARQAGANRIVALKIIRPDRLAAAAPESRQEAIERFRSETQAAARLEHDHIVPVYEVGEIDGQPFFSMRFVQGRSLEKVLRDGPLDAGKAAVLLEPIARAVHYAHGREIVHRDIKPRNILLDTDERPYVADFGLAKWLAAAQELTETGDVLGTAQYMAPEQARGEAAGSAGDVYSLGATLYELLTGRPPFRAATPAETQRQVIDNEPVPPRRLNPAVPRDLETICLKCLEKEPHKRYSTAEKLADELGRFQQKRPILARPITRPARTWRWCQRNPKVAGLAGALTCIVLAVAVAAPVAALYQASLRQAAEQLVGERDELVGKLETSIKQERIATWEAKQQRDAAKQEQQRATVNFTMALAAVDGLLRRIGDRSLANVPYMVRIRRKVLEDALKFYEKFLEQDSTNEILRAETGKTQARVGGINHLLGALPEALDAYNDSVAQYKTLVAEFPDNHQYRIDLAGAHSDLGRALVHSGKPAEAEAALQTAFGVAEELPKELREKPECTECLATVYGARSFVLEHLKRGSEAEEALGKAIEHLNKLVSKYPETSRYGDKLASARTSLGLRRKTQRRLTEAKNINEEVVKWWEGRVSELPDSPGLRTVLAHAYNNLGDVLDEMDQPDEALEVLRKALPLREKNTSQFPSIPQYQSALGATLNNLAKALETRRELREARVLVERAVIHQRRALAVEPQNPTYKLFLNNHYWLLTDVLLGLKDHTEAGKAAVERARVYPNSGSHAAWALNMLVCCAELARADQALPPERRETVVQGYLEQAKQMLQGVIRNARGPDDAVAAAWVLTDHPEPALRDAELAVELMQKVVRDVPNDPLHQHALGSALYRAGRWREAITELEESNRLARDGDGSNWLYQAMAYWQLGDKETARMWYEKAVHWQNRRPRQSGELRRLVAEAAELLGVAAPPAGEPNALESENGN